MKRLLCLLILLSLLMSVFPGIAEESYTPDATEIALNGRVIPEEPTHLTVANTTRVSGKFFTAQFGNNTSDMDVRAMIHGYDPIVWSTQLEFVTDPQVVKKLRKETDEEGNTTYTVSLLEDLLWNDGTPITASDYVAGYLLEAAPQFAEIGGDTDIRSYITGYEAYASGESEGFKGVRLINEHTYSVTVKAEYLPYFYELAMLSINPIPVDVLLPGCVVADSREGALIRNADEGESKPIFTGKLLKQTILDEKNGYLCRPRKTCGPYRMVSYNAQEGIVEFELNEYYKGNYRYVKPVINRVTLVPVKDEDIARKLETGEIDLINKAVEGETIRELFSLVDQGFGRVNYARLGYGFVSFACEQGPQQFQKVRQAIAYAFDKNRFTREYLQGFGLPVHAYYGLGQWMTEAALGILRPEEMTDEEMKAWDALNLDGLNPYNYDLNRAKSLLTEDGWTLNRNGKAFDSAKDQVRYKDVNGKLMPLQFTFGLTEGNKGAEMIAEMLQEAFGELGAELKIVKASFADVLDDYFTENGKRKFDMSFLASNFVSRFDGMTDFYFDEKGTGSQNASKIRDQELLDIATEMHKTAPRDVLGFLEKWVQFQERFNEVLPTMPIYSNIYTDVFTERLQNYYSNAEVNWPTAVLYAYIE